MENPESQNQVPNENEQKIIGPMSKEEEDALFDEVRKRGEEAAQKTYKATKPLGLTEDSIHVVNETPEEEKRRQNEEIERHISPELLKHFTPAEAHELIESFLGIPSVETQTEGGYDLNSIENNFLTLLQSEIKDKKVVEIGDVGRKINKYWFKKLGASGFIGIDTKSGDPDALTFLMRLPSESVIVCSFGVFDDGSLYFSEKDSLKKYINELCIEIFRVTPKNGISLHGLEYESDLINAGFTEEVKITPINHLGGSVVIFRKPNQ